MKANHNCPRTAPTNPTDNRTYHPYVRRLQVDAILAKIVGMERFHAARIYLSPQQLWDIH